MKTLGTFTSLYWRQNNFLILLLTLFFVLNSLGQFPSQPTHAMPKQPNHAVPNTFVTRSGSSLKLNGKPFRFSGANIYWLGLDENVGGIRYPTHFRVDDALTMAQEMGASVVRSHTLGISVGCPHCLEPSLGVFNESAFQHIDYAIMSAQKHTIRLIIPLVDNWHYFHGGKHHFTEWRGIEDENQFYYNQAVIGDFEQYIGRILNRVNSYTGVAYKNDPTILSWETGNNLLAPLSWVQTIAAYIKSIDTHHLVTDGNSGQSYSSTMFSQDLRLHDVDIYTGQYYPLNISALNKQAGETQRANKVFVAEEFAWNNRGGGDPLNTFLSAIENNFAVAGDLFWSLFGHKDTSGYVQHKDGYTLHYPGDSAEMRRRVQALCTHAYRMKND